MEAARIIQKAETLGFAAIGWTAADASVSDVLFQKWLAEGRAAGMRFLARHAALREHPARLLPGVKTVLAVAARYIPAPGRRGFAGYALAADYHHVLRKRLRILAEFILAAASGAGRYRICVDSAPLPEREWAWRAGLGWRGRQGALVHPQWGCCLFLGEILLPVDLPAHGSFGKHGEGCGDCRQCVSACPNGALDQHGLLDARRCAAYLTIEHPDVIPRASAGYVGECLFGCEICTAVCPRNPAPDDEAYVFAEFRPQAWVPAPTAEECLSMTDEGFQTIFQHTPVYRTGLARLQRNAVLVLYNQGQRLAKADLAGLSSLARAQAEELYAAV